MLSVQSLSSGYGEVGVLHDVSFDLESEVFAILGANGAGKTTLLKTLANLLPVSSGSEIETKSWTKFMNFFRVWRSEKFRKPEV